MIRNDIWATVSFFASQRVEKLKLQNPVIGKITKRNNRGKNIGYRNFYETDPLKTCGK